MSCVQVYTGDGKGKTTAALGLLLRAVGAGLSVRVFQFMKKGDYSEIQALGSRFPEVEVTQLGTGVFIRPGHLSQADLSQAAEGFEKAREAVLSGEYDVVILDELNGAVSLGLVPVEDVLDLMQKRPERTELVITGRDADARVVAAADLCTEMRKVKHYYDAGLHARKGIES